jgi:cytidyltransferase-like protein
MIKLKHLKQRKHQRNISHHSSDRNYRLKDDIAYLRRTMPTMIIGFTASAFDLLHAGHITMLREAKSQCDYLICGLQLDPSLDRDSKNSPLQTWSRDTFNCRPSNMWTK